MRYEATVVSVDPVGHYSQLHHIDGRQRLRLL